MRQNKCKTILSSHNACFITVEPVGSVRACVLCCVGVSVFEGEVDSRLSRREHDRVSIVSVGRRRRWPANRQVNGRWSIVMTATLSGVESSPCPNSGQPAAVSNNGDNGDDVRRYA